MSNPNAKENKAIVLEAFDPRSTSETTQLPSDFGRPTTFNIAPILSQDEAGSSS